MKTVCKLDQCVGCRACENICPKGAIKIVDSMKNFNAIIDEKNCINCNACVRICQNINLPEKMKPLYVKQGWTIDETIRRGSSSGGIATEIARTFVNRGGVVFACLFKNGQFVFEQAENDYEVEKFKGSKYVKSDLKDIYNSIIEKLRGNIKVLFIGLPCQVAALKNYIQLPYLKNLYTIDLICHGTPSSKVLNKFLMEKHINIKNVNSISFRNKVQFRLTVDKKTLVTDGASDRYTIGFLNGLFYTDNCYNCKYASFERVSDLTLGDSWGTNLAAEVSKGISLMLVQNEKGIELLNNPRIKLFDVDISRAIQYNHQLYEPTSKTDKQDIFFSLIRSNKRIDHVIMKLLPKQCIRQEIKEFILKLKN